MMRALPLHHETFSLKVKNVYSITCVLKVNGSLTVDTGWSETFGTQQGRV
jgi:hypothetical protein